MQHIFDVPADAWYDAKTMQSLDVGKYTIQSIRTTASEGDVWYRSATAPPGVDEDGGRIEYGTIYEIDVVEDSNLYLRGIGKLPKRVVMETIS